MANNSSNSETSLTLENILNNVNGLRRKDFVPFDAQAHLELGASLFNVQDYVKSFNALDSEFE